MTFRVLIERLLVVVLASLVGRAACAQDVTLPSTKPGQLVGALLKMCEVPRLDELTKWVTDNSPADFVARGLPGLIANDLLHTCATNGGFHAQKLGESDASAIALVVTGRKTNIWYTLGLRTNGDGKIAGWVFNRPSRHRTPCRRI
jgi:hypothetical protein